MQRAKDALIFAPEHVLKEKGRIMYKLILASQSPRRKELLKMIEPDFEIKVSNCEEKITSSEPKQVTMELAEQKAIAVATELNRQKKNDKQMEISVKDEDSFIVIGADTVVASDTEILGKPKDKDDARRMINKISGAIHQVYTGVALVLVKGGNVKLIDVFSEKTDVEVAHMSSQEIEEYISGTEPYDKAGGYGIQGTFGKYVTGIKGDYNNVVGLPVCRLYNALKKCTKNI